MKKKIKESQKIKCCVCGKDLSSKEDKYGESMGHNETERACSYCEDHVLITR